MSRASHSEVLLVVRGALNGSSAAQQLLQGLGVQRLQRFDRLVVRRLGSGLGLFLAFLGFKLSCLSGVNLGEFGREWYEFSVWQVIGLFRARLLVFFGNARRPWLVFYDSVRGLCYILSKLSVGDGTRLVYLPFVFQLDETFKFCFS